MFLPGTFLLTIVLLSAICALATPFVVRLLVAVTGATHRRNSNFLLSLTIWLLSSVAVLPFLHKPVFVLLHQSCNTLMPSSNCVSYDARFDRLYAKFQVDNRDEFIRWTVTTNLIERPSKFRTGEVTESDRQYFSFNEPELFFASKSGRLRAYYVQKSIYVAYNAF